MRRSLILTVVILSFGLMASAVRAAPASNPTELVNTMVSQGVALLSNTRTQGLQQRKTEFRTLLETDFDIPRIARFVLGRYWNGASPAERQDFNRLFEDWIVNTYSARFSEYNGETVRVTGTRNESATSTVVASQVLRPNGAPPAHVNWTVRKGAEGGYKVVDVGVEGVSMALTQRDEFASVIQSNGGTVAGLNKVLQQKLGSGTLPPASLGPGR